MPHPPAATHPRSPPLPLRYATPVAPGELRRETAADGAEVLTVGPRTIPQLAAALAGRLLIVCVFGLYMSLLLAASDPGWPAVAAAITAYGVFLGLVVVVTGLSERRPVVISVSALSVTVARGTSARPWFRLDRRNVAGVTVGTVDFLTVRPFTSELVIHLYDPLPRLRDRVALLRGYDRATLAEVAGVIGQMLGPMPP